MPEERIRGERVEKSLYEKRRISFPPTGSEAGDGRICRKVEGKRVGGSLRIKNGNGNKGKRI